MALFKVFYGSKENISNHAITNGSIYISTDTLQKFADFNGQRIQISDQNMEDSALTKINTMKQLLLNMDKLKVLDVNILSVSDGIANLATANYVYDDSTGEITFLS